MLKLNVLLMARKIGQFFLSEGGGGERGEGCHRRMVNRYSKNVKKKLKMLKLVGGWGMLKF